MRYTVDRITEKYVVLQNENGVIGNADKLLFPFVKEGDVLDIVPMQDVKNEKTDEMKSRLHSLFQKGKNNDES